jgi:NAD(P)-dependent dehydrogenase (short-subunit alcohol dehydrogenase family)
METIMNTTGLSMFNLEGKTAIVTGAGGGIGGACAEALAGAGAAVCCADLDFDAAKLTVERIRGAGGKAMAAQCNVADEASIATLIRLAEEENGPLDIMVNNAGTTDAAPSLLHDASTEDWNRVMSVNLNGVFFGAREALKVMFPRKSGRIINIASVLGMVGSSTVAPLSAYNASKGAVINLTRELGLQYAPHGITINSICPGPIHTRLGGVYEVPEIYALFVAQTPMGRVGDVKELKGSVIYLASEASSFVTGSNLVVDGGWIAR